MTKNNEVPCFGRFEGTCSLWYFGLLLAYIRSPWVFFSFTQAKVFKFLFRIFCFLSQLWLQWECLRSLDECLSEPQSKLSYSEEST